MIYVLDACVAVKQAILEIDSAKAIRLSADFLKGVHSLIAPDLFPTECGHVLMKAERKGTLAPGEAALLLQNIVNDGPSLFPASPLLTRAVEIALECNESVYDCLYVALAEREGCEMVTADLNLISATAAHYPFLVPLSSLPS